MPRFRALLPFCLLPILTGCGMFGASEPPSATVSTSETAEVVEPAGLTDVLGTLFGSPAVATEEPPEPTETALPVIPEEEETGGFWSFLGGFGDGGGEGSAPATEATASPGQLLPFGQLATACGLSTRDLGREVERASGYRVYDTNPRTTAPRTHYITGFSDGCARQFTAALAIFGDIGTHEIVRYGTADGGLPYSETDNAYERIKAEVCGARTGQPCGRQLDRFARRTTFLTVYQGFGSGAAWVDVLLHEGDVAAVDRL